MLSSGAIQHLAKQSVTYGYILSQPFSFYVDAYPLLQNELFQYADQDLTYGQHNEAVRVLQQKLHVLSYYSKDIDGEFGIYTEYALKKFQIENNITVSGNMNQETIAAIIRAERKKYLDPLQAIDRTYYLGETGEAIQLIQRALYYFGYYKDSIDGIFGPKTNQALYYYQLDHNMEVKQEINQALVNKLTTKSDETPQSIQVNEKTTNNASITVAKTTSDQTADSTQLITTAKKYLGTPYTWGGTSPSGFDCSGYIQYVLQQLNVQIPRTVSDIWNMSKTVSKLSIGDFVFFETYKKGPSHLGIYLGNRQFIHASESKGVAISSLDLEYWQQRYLGAKRVTLK